MLQIFLFLNMIILCLGVSAEGLDLWIKTESLIAQEKLHQNISPTDAMPGVVIASPSRQDPDYYFHWIRDSALVLDSLLTTAPKGVLDSDLLKTIDDFISLSRRLQLTPSLTGLGEPRFNIDGTPFNGPWARPQNDGPALRALTLLHLLDFNIGELRKNQISQILETDLDFIRTHIEEPSFDIWEEIRADHFYTRVVQMAALQKALLHFDSNWKFSIFDCEAARANLQTKLEKQWRPEFKYFLISLNRIEGGQNKKTDLDTAVILGILHAGLDQAHFFSVRDERILSTANQLENVFQNLYAINKSSADLNEAPAIGRYDDDVYFGGNPWYLTTLAYAEFHYRLAKSLRQNKNFQITALNLPFFRKAWGSRTGKLSEGINLAQSAALSEELIQALIQRGDQFIARVRRHTPADGGLSEQFSRQNGSPLSARDLTWSYASFLTAIEARKQIILKGVPLCSQK